MRVIKQLILLFLFLIFNSHSSELISYSGRLTMASGAPIAGPVSLTVEVLTGAGPTLKCSHTDASVALSNGVFHLEFDYATTCATNTKTLKTIIAEAVTAGDALYIRVTDNSNTKTYPVQSITGTPLAIYALGAESVKAQSITNLSINGITTNCTVGQVLKADGAGAFTCANDSTGGGGGTVTSVNPGTGITISGTAAAPVVNVNLSAAEIPNLDAAKITSGIFTTARIPNLDAAKITTGSFGVARIPSLDAAKITTGTFTAGQIPNLDAAKVTTGTFATGQIPNIDAGKVTSGTFATARIPSVTSAMISNGTIVNGDIATDTITFDRINAGVCGVGTVMSIDVAGDVVCTTPASGADDLGDHTATGNITLGTNYLSGDGGNEGIRVDTSGNVGVGAVAAAGNKLDVAGKVEIGANANADVLVFDGEREFTYTLSGTGASTSLDLVPSSDGLSYKMVSPDGTKSALTVSTHDTAASNYVELVPNGGKVGIGTSTLTSLLNIKSNIDSMDGGARLISQDGTKYGTISITNAGDFRFYNTSAAVTNSFRITAAGRVAIGSATADAKLHVAGDAKITSLAGTGTRCLQASSTGVISATGTACGSGGGGGTVTSIVAGSGLTGGTITTTGTLAVDTGNTAGKIPILDGSGNLDTAVETDPSVTAFAKAALPTCGVGQVLKGNGTSLTCVADLTIADTNTNATTICTGTNVLLADGSCVAMTVDTTVADTNTNATTICTGTNVLLADGSCVAMSSGADNLGNHTATANIQLGSNYLSGDGGNEGIAVDSAGNVGIGTFTPGKTLHVKSSSSNIVATFEADSDTKSFINFQNTTTTGTSTKVGDDAGNLVLVTGGTEKFRIEAAGNIKATSLAGTGTRCLQTSSTGVISATGTACGSGSAGETNTASSAGGTSLYKTKTSTDLVFKGLTASSDIALTANTNDVLIGIGSTNGNSQLVRLDASGRFPALDGSLITGITDNNTNTTTICTGTQVLLADGSCTAMTTDTKLTADGTTILDTAGTISVKAEGILDTHLSGLSTSCANGRTLMTNGVGSFSCLDLQTLSDNYFTSFGIGTTPDPSAALDVSSSTKGFLPPRMTTVQRDAIATPAIGLIIFDTTTKLLNSYDGTAWIELTNSSSSNIFVEVNNVGGSNQALSGGVAQKVIFGNELADASNNFATNTFTAPKTGKYIFSSQLAMDVDDNVTGAIRLEVAGTQVASSNEIGSRTGGGENFPRLMKVLDLSAGQTVEVFARCSSACTLYVNEATFFNIHYIGAGASGGALSADSVSATEIATSAVTSDEIDDGTVTGTDIASNTVTIDNLDFATTDGINIPQLAADPTGTTAGQTYYNTATKKIMFYDGSSWVEMGSGSGGGSFNLKRANETIVSGVTYHTITPTNHYTLATALPATTKAVVIGIYYNHGDNGSTHGYWTFDAYQKGATGTENTSKYNSRHYSDYANSDYTEIMVPWSDSLTNEITIETKSSHNTDSSNAYTVYLRGYITSDGGAVSADLSSNANAFSPPNLTTTARDALTPSAGDIIYNTTTGKLESYNGSSWDEVGSGSGGSSTAKFALVAAAGSWSVDPTGAAGYDSGLSSRRIGSSYSETGTLNGRILSDADGIFDSSKGWFVAPEAGLYLLNVHLKSIATGSSRVLFDYVINPDSPSYSINEIVDIDLSSCTAACSPDESFSVMLNLSSGDKIAVTRGSSGRDILGSGYAYMGFTLLNGATSSSAGSEVYFRASNNNSQSLTASTFEDIKFNVVDEDSNSAYNSSTGEWTAPEAGLYQISSTIRVNTLVDGKRVLLSLFVDGSEVIRNGNYAGAASATLTESLSTVLRLTAGQVVKIVGYNGDTVARTLHATSAANFLSIVKIGAGSGGSLTTDSVTATEIATSAVTSDEINDGSVTGTDLAANTVTVANLDFASTNGVNIPQLAADPGPGTAGQTYYNTATKKMMYYDGTTWIGLSSNTNVSFSVAATSGQAIPTSTTTKINFNIEEYDTASAFDMTNDRFQPTTAGYYYVHADILYSAITGWNNPYAWILKNGSGVKASLASGVTTGGMYPNVKISAVIYLNGTSDYLEFATRQSSGSTINLYNSTLFTNAYGFLISGGSGGGAADNLGSHTATQKLDLATNTLVGNGGTNGINIDASGNVGVGIIAPEANTRLHVRDDNAITDEAKVKIQQTDQKLILGARWESGVEQYSFIEATNNAESVAQSLVLNRNGGRVAIGTTSPSGLFHVHDATATNAAGRIKSTTTNVESVIQSAEGAQRYFTSPTAGLEIITDTNHPISFGVNESGSGTPEMIINTNGNVGIGTTTPDAQLEVVAPSLGTTLNNVVEMARFSSHNGNNNFLDIRQIRTSAGSVWNSAGTRIQEKIDSTWMGYMQFNGTGNDGGISFGTGITTTAPGNVAEAMRIDTNGRVGIGGNAPAATLDIKTADASTKLHNTNDGGAVKINKLWNKVGTYSGNIVVSVTASTWKSVIYKVHISGAGGGGHFEGRFYHNNAISAHVLSVNSASGAVASPVLTVSGQGYVLTFNVTSIVHPLIDIEIIHGGGDSPTFTESDVSYTVN